MGCSITPPPFEDPESDALFNLGLKSFVSDIDLDILGLCAIGDISTSGLKFAYWEFTFEAVPSEFELFSDGEGRARDIAALEILGEDRGEKATLLGEWLGIWGNFDFPESSPVSIAASDGVSIARFSNFWCKLGQVTSVESPLTFSLKQKTKMKLFSL